MVKVFGGTKIFFCMFICFILFSTNAYAFITTNSRGTLSWLGHDFTLDPVEKTDAEYDDHITLSPYLGVGSGFYKYNNGKGGSANSIDFKGTADSNDENIFNGVAYLYESDHLESDVLNSTTGYYEVHDIDTGELKVASILKVENIINIYISFNYHNQNYKLEKWLGKGYYWTDTNTNLNKGKATTSYLNVDAGALVKINNLFSAAVLYETAGGDKDYFDEDLSDEQLQIKFGQGSELTLAGGYNHERVSVSIGYTKGEENKNYDVQKFTGFGVTGYIDTVERFKIATKIYSADYEKLGDTKNAYTVTALDLGVRYHFLNSNKVLGAGLQHEDEKIDSKSDLDYKSASITTVYASIAFTF